MYKKLSVNNLLLFLIGVSFIQFNFFPFGRFFLTFIVFLIIFSIYKVGFNSDDMIFLLLFIILLFLGAHSSSDFNEFVMVVLKVFFAFIALYIGKNIYLFRNSDKFFLFKVINLFVFLCLSVDFYSRYGNLSGSSIFSNFYLIKFGSAIFSDSNGVAIYILICITINFLFFAFINKKIWFTVQFVLFLFLLSTFSRAGIFSFLIGIISFSYLNFYYSCQYKTRVFLIIMLIPLFFVSLFLAYSLVPIIASDGSGSTKFQIFNSFFDLIGLDILGDIFGRGLVSGGSYFSFQSGVKYAHSAIPLIIGIFGIIGFCVYGSILLYAMYRNRIFISTFAIFFVLGFSYLEVLFEGLFLLLGLSLNKHLVKDIN